MCESLCTWHCPFCSSCLKVFKEDLASFKNFASIYDQESDFTYRQEWMEEYVEDIAFYLYLRQKHSSKGLSLS